MESATTRQFRSPWYDMRHHTDIYIYKCYHRVVDGKWSEKLKKFVYGTDLVDASGHLRDNQKISEFRIYAFKSYIGKLW